MIAYNREWLDALLIKDAAEEWHDEGLLSADLFKNIQEQHPSPFYSPNIFVRIGLAIFCFVLLLAATGLLGVLISPNSAAGVGLLCLFISACCFGLLEKWIIPTANHHGSGIDDMLLYVAAGTAIGGIWGLMADGVDSSVAYAVVALPILITAGIRYTDRLAASAAFICGYILIYLIFKEIQPNLIFVLPLACMGYSAVVYYFTLKERKKQELRHWDGVLGIVELLAPIAFYASGNYWMVRETIVSDLQIETLPMEGFFWTFTFLVPFAYLYFGLLRKNRILVDLGIAAVAAALCTFRYYHSIMPLAWAASIGGAVLLAVAYSAIRYLNAGSLKGYTYAESGEKSLLQEAQEQLIEQTLGSEAPPTTRKESGMGGGAFGGGGSGGEF